MFTLAFRALILTVVFSQSWCLPQMKSPPAEDLPLQLTDILNQTILQHRHDSNGYKEHIMAYEGVVGLERIASDKGDETSLRLHEVTNGSLIVQLIFSPRDTLADCDVSNSRHHIRRLLKHVGSKKYSHKYSSVDKFSAEDAEEIGNLTDLSYWISKCNILHTHRLDIKPSQKSEVESPASGERIDMETTGQDMATVQRQKRGIMDLIYPGKCRP